MSLSVYTFLIFLFLVPGFIFRYAIYQGAEVKRAFFSSGSIHSAIAIVLYSVLTVFLFIAFTALSVLVFNFFREYEIPVVLVEESGSLFVDHRGVRQEVAGFLVSSPFTIIAIFFAVCGTAYVSAIIVQKLSRHIKIIGRLMYGPLAPLLSKSGTPFLTCFVLTKISHENRRLMYAGFPTEVSLKEGSNIDHLVLKNPEKFYLRINRTHPQTSLANARSISTQGYSESYMYISGTEIENVHFEGFYL